MTPTVEQGVPEGRAAPAFLDGVPWVAFGTAGVVTLFLFVVGVVHLVALAGYLIFFVSISVAAAWIARRRLDVNSLGIRTGLWTYVLVFGAMLVVGSFVSW